jgi:hypothetical protein
MFETVPLQFLEVPSRSSTIAANWLKHERNAVSLEKSILKN